MDVQEAALRCQIPAKPSWKVFPTWGNYAWIEIDSTTNDSTLLIKARLLKHGEGKTLDTYPARGKGIRAGNPSVRQGGEVSLGCSRGKCHGGDCWLGF